MHNNFGNVIVMIAPAAGDKPRLGGHVSASFQEMCGGGAR